MKHKRPGDRIPDVTFRTRTDFGWKDVTTKEIFDGKDVVVFSLPGAFTPTCSSSQLPGYNRAAATFKAHGIDEVVCISVNDAFVMNEWCRTQRADQVTLVPDGNGEFTEAMGMLVDKRDLGFGARSWRYSMLVRDGVIDALFVEPDKPGDPYEVSDPETMLKHIAPQAALPDAVALLVRAGCAHCARAKAMLDARGIAYDVVEAATGDLLQAISGARTTPQVFIGGEHIGGADDLARYLERRATREAA